MAPLFRLLLPKGIVRGPAGRYLAFNRFTVDGPAYGGLLGPARSVAAMVSIVTPTRKIVDKGEIQVTEEDNAMVVMDHGNAGPATQPSAAAYPAGAPQGYANPGVPQQAYPQAAGAQQGYGAQPAQWGAPPPAYGG